MKKLMSVFGIVTLVLAVSFPASAVITVVIDDDAGNDAAYVNGTGGNLTGATALETAVNTINVDPTVDSFDIQIIDTDGVQDTYTGVMHVSRDNVTIRQVANGNGNDVGVSIVGTDVVSAGVVMAYNAGFTLQGLSATVPMTLQTAGGTDCTIVTGAIGTAVDAIWENLTYVNTANAALDHNDYFGEVACTEQFNNCTFAVGNGPQTFGIGVTFNSCTFAGGGFKNVGLGGTMTLNDCIVTPGAGGFHLAGVDELTLNNCQINSGDARLFWSAVLNAEGVDITLNDPVFTGKCGDIMADITNGPHTLSIIGSDPTNKVDLGPLGTAGTVLGARTLGGAINFVNCTDSVGMPAGLVDCAQGVDMIADLTVTMDQCEWLDGRSGDFIAADAGAGAFKTDFTATNCIWAGTSPTGHIVDVQGGHTVASSISLTHCTLIRTTGDAHLFGNAGRGDTITLDGCIAAPSYDTGGALFSIAPVQGPLNIPNVGYVTDPDANYDPIGIAGTIFADPLLDATGHISSGGSSALEAATNSAVAVDVDGDSRPLTGTVADIGADESDLEAADLTAPVIDAGGVTMIDVSLDSTYPVTVTATDDVDGDVTANLVVTIEDAGSNAVADIATMMGAVGTYTVTYNVSDTAGNAATPVVITVNVLAMVDTDNDGMDDAWEEANGLIVGTNDADGDADNDGASNLREYLDDTDPQDATSKLPIAGSLGLVALGVLLAGAALRRRK